MTWTWLDTIAITVIAAVLIAAAPIWRRMVKDAAQKAEFWRDTRDGVRSILAEDDPPPQMRQQLTEHLPQLDQEAQQAEMWLRILTLGRRP